MSRVIIPLPDKFSYTHSIVVRVTDLNYGGHLGNDRFLAYAQEARNAYFQSLGYTEVSLRQDKLGTVVSDSAIIYKQELFAADEIEIKVGVQDFHKYGFDLFYSFIRKSDQTEAARVKTGIICFDYSSRSIARIPEGVVAKFKES